jgi:AraC family transcriptional regulator
MNLKIEGKIKMMHGKTLLGMRERMSFAGNRTRELWQRFMPARDAIPNRVGADMYSLQKYSPSFFSAFNPAAEFDKWAAVEVTDVNAVPDGMEVINLISGLYAVFVYKGRASEAAEFYQYIFATWIPRSGYELDDRLHFEILGAKYKHEHPDSEEEVWIPVRLR